MLLFVALLVLMSCLENNTRNTRSDVDSKLLDLQYLLFQPHIQSSLHFPILSPYLAPQQQQQHNKEQQTTMPTSRASFRFQSSALFLLTASTTITTVFAGYVTPPIVYRDDYARTTLLPPSQGQEIDISAATGFPLYIATTEVS